MRLTSPVDVLRQDRANVHRFGIMQAGDTWDPWFGSIEVRAAIPALVKAGVIGPRARQVLLNGRGRIYVAVYGTRRGLTRLVVRMNPPS
ncbi:MAG: hypothetical protein D6801_01730 [Alphaproteobacteria bacterium]|nr:MAG: hypothetical protein D6801_01730 [Alphaproteobacteria bacterium]